MDQELLQILRNASPRILVIGDIMLDRYTEGLVERVSPEAPVLVMRVDSEDVRLGGAASVASLLRGLGAEVELAGVVGTDSSSHIVRKLFDEAGIGCEFSVEESLRPTTVKWRVMGRPEHRIAGHLLRIDYESQKSLETSVETELISKVLSDLSSFEAVLISDYGKGVCTEKLVQAAITAANAHKIPVIIDPVARGDFSKYRGASVLKPNRAAASQVTGKSIETPNDAFEAACYLREAYEAKSVVITLDKDGMVLDGADVGRASVGSAARYVRDITGAGDMVQAMLGFAVASRIPISQAIGLANIAAGLEVEHHGVEAITWDDLNSVVSKASNPLLEKIVTVEELEHAVQRYRFERKRVVLTNGCFDLLHVGHLSYLQEAASLGDKLIVAINTDSSIRKLKGLDRPINQEQHRALMLAGLACVDHVVVFPEDTPHALLRRVKPDVLVKGGTYSLDEVIGREVVHQHGGEVMVLGQIPDISTTNIIRQIHRFAK